MGTMKQSREHFNAARERFEAFRTEAVASEAGRAFFEKEAGEIRCFLGHMDRLYDENGEERKEAFGLSFEALKAANLELYRDILPENYGSSCANPDTACAAFGPGRGPVMAWLAAELRGMIPFAYEYRPEDAAILLDLYLDMAGLFEKEKEPEAGKLQALVRAYHKENCALFTRERVAEFVDPSLDFARRIIMESDLSDLRYLFRYGLYISEDEIRTAEFLNRLPEEETESMARVYTEGYRKGFENAGIDLSKKKTVNIRYRAGFERMIRPAVRQFEEMGLGSVIYRIQSRSLESWSPRKNGYEAGNPNPQFDFDHSTDHGLYLDEEIVSAKLEALAGAYESMKALANTHAGPAVVETFGDTPFMPESKDSTVKLSEEQQKLLVKYQSEAGQITKKYIIGEERSFTIIAWPVPAIGRDFEEIFRETVRINTLDYKTYEAIQQKLIDALDQGVKAVVKGKNGNRTDLTIALAKLTDPAGQTKFENCVADVNIPVGEVLTSPVLEGTNGVLHVQQIYLNSLNYIDLEIRVKDGMIADYRCANFDSEEKNRNYIEENILFHHKTVPMGEFAIGTNTTAFEVQNRFGIQSLMPILIYEKTGPHFAFGDTCFSWQEELHTFNPDGKEMIAKDNSCSILRKSDVSKAYFNCHTDITIPYNELDCIKVVKEDGGEIPLIEDGLFVLDGCEELNAPLLKMREK